jgi:peptidoglycan/LPS O-acetylase OafA/YrhL
MNGLNSPLWYFSYIIFYYLTFPILFNKKILYLSPFLILAASFYFATSELPIKVDVLNLYKVHYLSFPIGVLIGVLYFAPPNLKIIGNLNFDKWFIRYPALLIGAYFVQHLAIYSGVGKGIKLEQVIAQLTVMCLLLVSIFKPVRIKFLSFVGKYSYEIYLMHWPILLRYDLFFSKLPGALSLTLYIILFLILAYCLNKAYSPPSSSTRA